MYDTKYNTARTAASTARTAATTARTAATTASTAATTAQQVLIGLAIPNRLARENYRGPGLNP